jgi:type IV pilus assembly protein PilM
MANIFSKIINSITGSSGSGDHPDGVVGVEFSAGSVKVIQLKEKNGSPVLETYGELALGPYDDKPIGAAVKSDPKILGQALNDIINEAGVTTKHAGVSIPISASLVNIISLPPVSDPEKLAQIIPMEARKYIPVQPSEVLMDWDILPNRDSRSDGAQEALVVAIHKEAINRYRSALMETDLNVGFFEIEIFSSIRATLDRGIEPVLLIDLGIASSKIYIVEHGVVRGSHTINQGGQDITRALASRLGVGFDEAERIKRQEGLTGEGEDADAVRESARTILNYIFSKTNDIVVDYQKKNAAVVEEVVLTGGGSIFVGIDKIAEKMLNIKARRADPFSKLETPHFLSKTLKQIGPEFAVAIGTALRRLQE